MSSRALLVLLLTACPGGDGGGPPDSGGPACAVPGGTVTHVNDFTGTETWAATSVHQLTNTFTIAAGATVTIEPCAKVLIKPGAYFYVNGTLIAKGDATHPITIEGDGDRFASLDINDPGTADLAYVTIRRGGATPQSTWGANIIVEGNWPVVRSLKVDHVTIEDAAGYGIAMRSYGAFTADSTDLTITNCGKVATQYPYPLRMSANTLGSVPTGRYTGNQVDEIQLVGENPHYQFEVDDVLHQRGVPYRVGGGGPINELRIGAVGSVPTLTIEPGVTVRIDTSVNKAGRVYVGVSNTSGKLIAVGTAEKRIVFTSGAATQAPGDWIGVDFSPMLVSGNRLELVDIEYAGAPGGASGYGCLPMSLNRDDAALRIYAPPGASFFQSSSIAHSLGHGVLSAWTGGEVDFKAGNTFTDVAGCEQVRPKPTPPASCPAMPTCQ